MVKYSSNSVKNSIYTVDRVLDKIFDGDGQCCISLYFIIIWFERLSTKGHACACVISQVDIWRRCLCVPMCSWCDNENTQIHTCVYQKYVHVSHAVYTCKDYLSCGWFVPSCYIRMYINIYMYILSTANNQKIWNIFVLIFRSFTQAKMALLKMSSSITT